eukprot:3993715-Pleurochrysis_carterae.AAC.1
MVSLITNVVFLTAAITAGIIHALDGKPGNSFRTFALLAMIVFLFSPTRRTLHRLLVPSTRQPPPTTPNRHSRRSTRALPQGNDRDLVLNAQLSYLARSTPLSCARDDALRRMFCAVAKLRWLTAAGCLTLALVHTYWMAGHRMLRFCEPSDPLSVTHTSLIDFDPAFRFAA